MFKYSLIYYSFIMKIYYDKYADKYFDKDGLIQTFKNLIYSLECGVNCDVKIDIKEKIIMDIEKVADYRAIKKYVKEVE